MGGCLRMGWKSGVGLAVVAALLTAGLAEGAGHAVTNGRLGKKSPFGIFGVFNLEYPDFQSQMRFTDQEFLDWAGEHFRKVGAKYSRQNTLLVWDQIESTIGGGYQWTCKSGGLCGPDPILKNAFAEGMDSLNMVLVINPHRDNGLDYTEENALSLKNFIKAAVERYDGDGQGDADSRIVVKYWQAFNEPFDVWEENGGTFDGYVRFVRLMSQAVKEADPEAKVMLGALFSDSRGRLDRDATDVLAQLKDENAFDIADIHQWGDEGDWKMESAQTLRVYLDRMGYENAEIWSTENGTYVNHPTGTSAYQSETDQAASLVKRYIYNLAHGVDKIFWNNLVDWSCFDGDCGGQFDNMGLISDGSNSGESASDAGKPRLSYFTYKFMVDTLKADDDLEMEVIQESRGRYVYSFRMAGETQPVYVAWRERQRGSSTAVGRVTFAVEGGATFQLKESVPNADTGADLSENDYPGFFTTSTVTAKDGQVTIEIGEVPVYLVLQEDGG